MNNVKIGVFDSSVGGFSILKSLFAIVPNFDFFYQCDEDVGAYGSLGPKEIIDRTERGVNKLLDYGCELIVIACNTATAYSIDKLRKTTNVPLVGVEPYVNIINKDQQLKDKNVAILVTPSMAKSERLTLLINKTIPFSRIEILPMEGLASFANECFYKNKVDREKLKNLLKRINGFDLLILGCTHYPLLKSSIESVTKTPTICPSDAIAKRVLSLLGSGAGSCGGHFHFSSDFEKNFEIVNREILDQWPK